MSSTIIYVDDDGGGNFTSIQEAINAANDGDVIYVYNGEYKENINITKSITLRGQSKKAIINGSFNGDVITIIDCDNVTIMDLSIIYSGDNYYGIKLHAARNCIIKNCNISENYAGVGIIWSNGNLIIRNILSKNTYGVYSNSGKNNRMEENIFSNNINAIRFGDQTSYNIIRYNNFFENSVDAIDEGYSNYWDYEHVGNYWDKYAGDDADGDGIGDTPYVIYGDVKDHYPLMENYTGVDIFPPDIINLHANPQIQVPNGSVNITCTIIDNVEVNCTYINITVPNGGYVNESLNRIDSTDSYYFNSTFNVKGVYYYYVWANDTSNNSEKTDLKKFVIAYKPHANFSYTPTNPTDLDNVTFNASSSYDPDNGSIVNYTWELYIWRNTGYELLDTLYGETVIYKFDENSPSPDKPHKAKLTVFDNDGAWDIIEKDIYVANVPPVANFTFSGNFTVGEPILFSDLSYDLDGDIREIEWDFGDGTIIKDARDKIQQITYSYSKDGTFNITLTVWDDDYDTDNMTKQVTIEDVRSPRILNLSAYPNPQEINEYVNISCDIYDDVAVAVARINITFPNGTFINDSMVNGSKYYYRIYCDQQGEHFYYIWTSDKSGNANVSSIQNFTIIKPPEPPHIRNISINPDVQQYGYPVNISCYVYDNVAVGEVRMVFNNTNISMTGITDDKGNGIYYCNSTFEMGWHEFYIYTVDINGYSNFSANYSFEIIDTLPPSITNVTFPQISQPGIINISCYIYDNRDVASAMINITNGTTYINKSMLRSGNLFYINEFLDSSDYNFSIWANDVSNNSIFSSIYNFTITYFPIANFSYAPSNATIQDTIQFTDLSYDLDGSIVNWTWSFGDGNISYEQNPSHQYANNGNYTVNLTVRDNDGAIASIQKYVTVLNIPPSANFVYYPSSPTTQDIITFNASSSYDVDGHITLYEWDWDNDGIYDESVNTTIVNHSWSDNGNYSVTLRVTDDDGAISIITKTIEIFNVPPVANFSYIPTSPKVNETVQFTDSSYDLDGSLVNYTWNFGDGNISYEENPLHAYAKEGVYTVTLTVRDDDGAVATIEKEIVVGVNLVADFSYSPNNPTSLQSIQFMDLSVGASSWLWDFGDGTTSNEQNPVHVYALGNYYNVTLTIFNGSKNISITKTVKVDTKIQIFKNEDNVVNYIPWLGNETTASELADLIGSDIMPTGSVVSKWNTTKGVFDSYIVGVSPPEYDFVIHPYDAIVLRVANGGEFIEGAIKLADRIVSLFKNENNVVNHIVWSCLNETTASELANLIGSDIMPTGSVVSKWNTTKGAFDSYIVGVSPPEYDFVISPGDVIILRVANGGEFVIEVIK